MQLTAALSVLRRPQAPLQRVDEGSSADAAREVAKAAADAADQAAEQIVAAAAAAEESAAQRAAREGISGSAAERGKG